MPKQPRGCSLYGFDVLPGGDHILVYRSDGAVSVWNLSHTQTQGKRNRSVDAAKGIYHSPSYVGKLLASFDVGFALGGVQHLAYYSEGRNVLVCALSNDWRVDLRYIVLSGTLTSC